LTAALASNSVLGKKSFAAISPGTTASVQVAQLREGKDNTTICFAYGTVYGNVDASALPSFLTIQLQLDSKTNVVTDAIVDTVSSEHL
ncbi:unnamed protein product, partial [Strongylus vulgaris]